MYGKSTAPFLSCPAKKLVAISGDPRKRQWLNQHLSLALVRGNTASILACVQAWSDFSHPQCINQCSCPSLASLQCIAIAFWMSVSSVSFIVFSMFFFYAFCKQSLCAVLFCSAFQPSWLTSFCLFFTLCQTETPWQAYNKSMEVSLTPLHNFVSLFSIGW